MRTTAETTTEVTSNADIWDAWPVDAARFGEATATARRAAGDALGASEVGQQWSARVDDALHGLDALDPSRLDAWMQAHAESPVPEVYEARLVAAWESHADVGSSWEWPEEASDVVDLSDEGTALVESMHDPDVSEFSF